jgi:hypothetical protein
LVTFIIGTEKAEFIVHREYICHYSVVLRAAFNNERFIEGKTQTYIIDDTTAKAFRLLVQWVYSQSIITDADKDDETRTILEKETPEWRQKEWRSLLELWMLADKFNLPRLQNLAMDKLILHQDMSEDVGCLARHFTFVWYNTVWDTPLQWLCLRQCLKSGPDFFSNHWERIPQGLIEWYVSSAARASKMEKRMPVEVLRSSLFVPETT